MKTTRRKIEMKAIRIEECESGKEVERKDMIWNTLNIYSGMCASVSKIISIGIFLFAFNSSSISIHFHFLSVFFIQF